MIFFFIGYSIKNCIMGNTLKCFSKSRDLENISSDDVQRVPHQYEIVPAKIVKVYDGDTVMVIFKHGNMYLKYNIRLFGIDAPEIRGSSPREKQAAEIVRDNLISLLPEGSLRNIRIKSHDKYGGRLVGDIFVDDSAS